MGDVTKVNVLGSEWAVIDSKPSRHPMLKNCDGYCDHSVRQIIIDSPLRAGRDDVDILAPEVSDKRIRRHELIHAFLFESGLADDSGWAVNEAMVDYFARQFPKMLKASQEAGAI